jgi:malonyl-CoA decarboxylase
VHEIDGWSDLQRRLDPRDRRCFGFFHPSLVDDPLIFVEVALENDVPEAIAPLLDEDADIAADEEPTTAVFYSISNCQEGLRGISFGNFLIKQVVEELAREKPSLKTFVTLSPVPTFARWLDRVLADDTEAILTPADREVLHELNDPSWPDDEATCDRLKPHLMALAAHYFMRAKSSAGLPVDPVARFHLGNGALLERINWKGDLSEKGLRNAHGLMVNYRYDLKEIEKNHEAFVNEQAVVASRGVRSLLRSQGRPRLRADDAGKLLALPGARTASADVEENSDMPGTSLGKRS